MPSCNTCEKPAKERNSIICNFSFSKIYLRCNYLNYVDSQYIKYSNTEWWPKKYCNCLFLFYINNHKLFSLFSDQAFCSTESAENWQYINNLNQIILMTFNILSNQQIFILMPFLFQSQESVKISNQYLI